jgi:hypothetical protein
MTDPTLSETRAAGFPRVSSYLERLTGGIDAYPECLAKASVSLGAIHALPEPMETRGLPASLASHLERPPRPNEWIPETLNVAVYLAIADRFFQDEDPFQTWVYGIGRAMFRSPMYRVLMRVMSPERLAKGGGKRWSAFHRGTTYEVELEDDGTASTIGFPPRLFNELFIRGTLQAVLAAYHASGAPNATAEILELTEVSARTRVQWHRT